MWLFRTKHTFICVLLLIRNGLVYKRLRQSHYTIKNCSKDRKVMWVLCYVGVTYNNAIMYIKKDKYIIKNIL